MDDIIAAVNEDSHHSRIEALTLIVRAFIYSLYLSRRNK